MESCARKIHFCYGHRVMKHESKCAGLHGHNGVLWIHATPAKGLDSIGRVVDFSVLKDKVGGWVDKHWDHTMILYREDQETIKLVQQAPKYKDCYILDQNPTAENMASYILKVVCPQVLAGYNIIVHKVVLWETENCFATQQLDPNDPIIRKAYSIPSDA